MADPKFANLPGIAYDETDVYETPDIPEDSTSDYYEDAIDEAIERLHFSSNDSNNKFKGKYLTGNVDYMHNDVRGGCWNLAAYGEKETPIEKYHRIKCEIDELMNEIIELNASTDISKKDKKSYESVSLAVNSAQKVLGSLKLENVLGNETISSASDKEIKKLIAQVEGFQKDGRGQISVEQTKNQLEHKKRIAELEARLHHVETIIGTHQPEKLNRLTLALDTNGSLIDSVQHISTKAALLQPAQLDQIETRILALTAKLNAINEKSSIITGKQRINDDKIMALYDIVKKVEPVAKLLPDILNRMQALESLHTYANNFNKTITELQSTQSLLVSTLDGNKALLQNVQETFALNVEAVNKEVGKLESRLQTFKEK